ncbi:MAG: hypothetical protein WCR01_13705 [Bacteroidota bacterium]
MKNSILLSVCVVLLFSFTGFSQTSAPTTKEFKTKKGKVITVEEAHPNSQSLSDITVAFAGNPGSAVPFIDVDPINKVLVADLDGNGYDEIYIITLNVGTGSYGNVLGVASIKDKSLSMITFPEVTESDMKKGGKFQDYVGHDVYEINKNTLVRTFPLKTKDSKKTRSIIYKLKAGEAAYQLVIVK